MLNHQTKNIFNDLLIVKLVKFILLAIVKLGQIMERIFGFVGRTIIDGLLAVGRLVFGLLALVGNGLLLIGRGVAGAFLWLLRLPLFILNSLWVGLKFVAWLFIQPWIFLGRMFLKIILGFGNAIKWLSLLLVGGAVASASGLQGQAQKLWQKPSKPHAWPRWVTALLIILAIIAPFKLYSYYQSLTKIKANVANASAAALADLDQAKSLLADKDFTQAQTSFASAGQNFLLAQDQLSQINSVFLAFASLAPDQQMQLAGQSKNILLVGQIAAKLGENVSGLLSGLLSGQANRDWIGLLNKLNSDSAADLALANQLAETVKNINPDKLPLEYRQKFVSLAGQSQFLVTSLTQIKDMSGQLAIFLGAQASKRYLLVFQNNAELRASGGFIGSYAVLDFDQGKLTDLQVPTDGSYATDKLMTRKIVPPLPWGVEYGWWHMRDANWWPDWPLSAKKVMWFYEISGGSTTDGVISLTPTVMERLLTAIGPIDMTDKYGVVITADNFWSTTQQTVEQLDVKKKYGHPVEPKKMIGDLFNAILTELPKRLNNKETLLKVMQAMESSLAEKQILLYFNDSTLEKEMSDLGWDGRVKNAPQDYLQVVNSNYQGQKSDRVTKEDLNYKINIAADGSVTAQLTITRQNQGIAGTLFTGVPNRSLVRIYVPQGSQLLSAQGFFAPPYTATTTDPSWEHDSDLAPQENALTDPASQTKIYNELGKTVFANWLITNPGQTVQATLTYQLPFKLRPKAETDWYNQLRNLFANNQFYSYSLLVQKQPGVPEENFSLKVYLPSGQSVAWTYPDSAITTANGFSDQTQLVSDQSWAGVFNIQK